MKSIGREDDLERLNRDALRMARKVADETGTLMAGNLCNSAIYSPGDAESHKKAKDMFIVSEYYTVCSYISSNTLSIYSCMYDVCLSFLSYLKEQLLLSQRLGVNIQTQLRSNGDGTSV